MKGRAKILSLILCFLLLTGCYAFGNDEFYSLPKRSEQYRALQTAVEAAMDGGAYSPPVAGPNRQAVQQVDLDGDGHEEVLVFCKQEGEHPLKLLLLKRDNDDYRLIATLEGDGTAFDSVQYAQIDGQPGQEILLSRRIGEQVQQFLSVYTLINDAPKELLSTGYNAYTTLDIDSDQLTDIFLIRANSDGPRAFAELYHFKNEELQKDAEANLSTAADSVKRILTGNVAQDVPAVFVASAYDENNLITDVFALENGQFSNISQNDESGQSSQTVRNYYVYSTDIDNDGLIEMPNTVPLLPEEGDESSEGQYRIVWYNLGVDGTRSEKISTYHNFAEGWFLFLPEAWGPVLSVGKAVLENGVGGTRFSVQQADGSMRELMTVFAFTGENAARRAEADGRTVLAQRGDVYFAASVCAQCDLSVEELQARFSFIAVDLLPGEG